MGNYSIWVLDYAAVAKFPQSVMLYGPQYQGIRNLPYAYVLIKGQGEVILVDTGYDHKEYGKYLADTAFQTGIRLRKCSPNAGSRPPM
jgi:N-acyl homoserine lactone hydrolase